MSSKRVFGTCCLCGQHGELRDGHIVPAWCFEHLKFLFGVREPALVFLDERTSNAIVSNKALREHLLCASCEGFFSEDHEKYASTVLVQKDGSFPWLERTRSGANTMLDSSGVDADALARFACSVVWRASVCTKLSTNLGAHQKPLAEYLQRRAELPDDVAVIATLIENKVVQPLILPPQQGERDGCQIYWFVACGVVFNIFVGPVPELPRSRRLVRKRVVLRSNGDWLERIMAAKAALMTPKAKLATMG